LPSRWSSTRDRWVALGLIWPGGTRHRGAGRPASRRVHTPSGPRKSGMPESVLMPAPVKATMRSHSMIHRAIVSMCCSRRCSSVTVPAVKRLVAAKTDNQAAWLECMRCCSVEGTPPNGRKDVLHVSHPAAPLPAPPNRLSCAYDVRWHNIIASAVSIHPLRTSVNKLSGRCLAVRFSASGQGESSRLSITP
jgi:hypothetical protein